MLPLCLLSGMIATATAAITAAAAAAPAPPYPEGPRASVEGIKAADFKVRVCLFLLNPP